MCFHYFDWGLVVDRHILTCTVVFLMFQPLCNVHFSMCQTLFSTRRTRTSQLQFKLFATRVLPSIRWTCSTAASTLFAPRVATGQHFRSSANVRCGSIQHFNFMSCKHFNLPSRLQCLADVFVWLFISFFTQLLLALLVCSSNFVLDSRSSHDSGLLYSASSTAFGVFLNLTN